MSLPETPPERLQALAQSLSEARSAWLKVPLARRLVYLDEIREATYRIAERWVDEACKAKGLGPLSYLGGEEWLIGPMVTLRNLRLLKHALRSKGRPPYGATRRGPDGRAIIQVVPGDFFDRLMWMGITGEVWIQPGKPSSQGAIYSKGHDPGGGRLCLVLAAGNVASIAPTDALYKLFVENQVVLMKMNPVNEYMGPILEEIFYPLIRDKFMGVIYGGAQIGKTATEHPLVDTIHITGSHHTYDAIVWGPGSEGAQNKDARTPKLTKPVTSELGCVTPVLIVPGAWSEGDLGYQARHVAGMVSMNAGFNCNAAQLLVTSKHWKQREAFLHHLRKALRELPARKAYYPGAEDRYRGFVERYPQAEPVASPSPGCLPWTLIPGVNPDEDPYALRNESFCGLLCEVALEAEGAAAFLAQSVPFVNERVWGNLSCTVLIHSETEKAEERGLARAVEELRYGGIGVNLWGGLIFGFMSTSWGAYPGNPDHDIQSGQGVVHNALLFDHVEKSVIKGPFRTPYVPPWMPGHPRLRQVGKALTDLEFAPSLGKAMAVQMEVLRGGLWLGGPEPLRLPAGRT